MSEDHGNEGTFSSAKIWVGILQRMRLLSFIRPTNNLETGCSRRHNSAKQWDMVINTTLFHEGTGPLGTTVIRRRKQMHNWDCGITCLEMICDWLWDSEHRCHDRRAWMLQLIGTESIWTVDLVWILQSLSDKYPGKFSYLFCTKELTVNDNLSQFHYYKDAFAQDRPRILNRFTMIAQRNLPTFQCNSLKLDDMIYCIQNTNCIAMVLVDNQILTGNNAPGESYTGHYILLLGISKQPECIRLAMNNDPVSTSHHSTNGNNICLVLGNPADESASYITLPHFERAWKAPGTDNDIIFVAKSKCYC